MIAIDKILYGTDLTERSEPAFRYAETLARLSGAELHVLHVIGELADRRRTLIPQEQFEILEKEVEVHAVKELKAFCSQIEGVRYTPEVVVGVPFQQILSCARRIGAKLIVIGTHSQMALEHVLVGSTAERIVRRSEIPVLTVRAS